VTSPAPLPARTDVVIVGAGLAGLVAARMLEAAGRGVTLLEASDGVGGRVRSDEVDGFILDRGFQVYLTGYPEPPRHLDIDALDLRRFEPGALVWRDGRGSLVSDPFRRPLTLPSTVMSTAGTIADKLRIAALRRRLVRADPRELLRGADVPTRDALRDAGFSDAMVQRFFRPLVGGIQLDPGLGTSRRMFDVIFRTLAVGDSAVPARGMGEIPRQLAAGLAPTTVHLGTEVARVAPGRVDLADGRSVAADAVIVATEGPVASRLLGLPDVASRSVACVYFDAPEAPVRGAHVILDGGGSGPVLNVAVMSEVAPSYAPAGHHLVAAAMPGATDADPEAAARSQLEAWWGEGVRRWRHLRTYRISHGQPGQDPPFSPMKKVSLGNGLFVCGDHRDTGSIQGAMFSGRRCAEAVLATGPHRQ